MGFYIDSKQLMYQLKILLGDTIRMAIGNWVYKNVIITQVRDAGGLN